MFRPLMLTIFRLYMDLSSSYTTETTYVGCFFRCGEGVCMGPRSRLCQWWLHCLEHYHYFIHALFLAMSRMGFIILYP